MLAPIKNSLAKKRIILASGSPSRQKLIQKIGLSVELCPSTFEENLNIEDYNFSDFVELTALGKANEVYDRLKAESPKSDLLVISGDTIVTLGTKTFVKPDDADEAVQMLTKLSGNCNVTYTGVVVKHSEGVVRFTESTKVYFGELTREQIQAYVDSGEPLGKSGAYDIGGLAGPFIEKIEGDFYSVRGLPLHRLSVELCKLFDIKE